MNPEPRQQAVERPRKGDRVETTILDVGDRDLCFGRLADGMGVFVQGPVAVGDRVAAEIFKVKKNYVSARLCEVLELSPHRVEPRCAHFGVCGGCKWQHVDYDEQVRIKRKRVGDVLTHIGGVQDPPLAPAIPAVSPYHYRNKIEFSFSGQRYLLETEDREGGLDKPADFALGFHAPRFYEKVVDIDECHIATPEMSKVLVAVKAFCRERGLSVYSTKTHEGFLRNLVIRHAGSTGQLMVNLVTSSYEGGLMAELCDVLQGVLGDGLTTFVNNTTDRKNTVAIGDAEEVVYGPAVITERVGQYEFALSANSFFQTNSKQALRLYDVVVEQARLQPTDVVYDLYSGIGVIALYISSLCESVLGIEVVDSAVRDARANADHNQVDNCRFEKLDLKDIRKVEKDLAAYGHPDVVIVDPPRAGLHPNVVKALDELAPRRIVYVSCNPASLARDVKILLDAGTYRLETVVPIDMFPHTNHVECVARLERVQE
jgi:23S rRNA (uracil1939-C5)-methyltransferase